MRRGDQTFRGENVGVSLKPGRPKGGPRPLKAEKKREACLGPTGWAGAAKPGLSEAARAVTSCTPPSCCCAIASNMPSNRSSSCSPPIASTASHAPRSALCTRTARSPRSSGSRPAARLQSSAFRSGAGNTHSFAAPARLLALSSRLFLNWKPLSTQQTARFVDHWLTC